MFSKQLRFSEFSSHVPAFCFSPFLMMPAILLQQPHLEKACVFLNIVFQFFLCNIIFVSLPWNGFCLSDDYTRLNLDNKDSSNRLNKFSASFIDASFFLDFFCYCFANLFLCLFFVVFRRSRIIFILMFYFIIS